MGVSEQGPRPPREPTGSLRWARHHGAGARLRRPVEEHSTDDEPTVVGDGREPAESIDPAAGQPTAEPGQEGIPGPEGFAVPDAFSGQEGIPGHDDAPRPGIGAGPGRPAIEPPQPAPG